MEVVVHHFPSWTSLCLGLSVGCSDLSNTTAVATPNPDTASALPTSTPSATPSPAPSVAKAACSGGFAVCDDFEAEAPGRNPNTALWTVMKQNSNETVTIDSNRAFSGKQSVHIHTTNHGYEQAMLVNSTLFPVTDNTFYGRMYMYFAGNQPQTHFNLVTAWGTLQGQSAATYINYGGQYDMFLANYYNANNSQAILDLWQHAGVSSNGNYIDTTAMPTDRWACLEWEFKGNNNEMHMWLDGNLVSTMSLAGIAAECCQSTVWAFPPFRQVAMGWTLVGNQEAFDHFDLWLDAIVLDGQRIGCMTP